LKKRLTIIYYGDVNPELDNDLEKCLSKYGYRIWTSGYNLITDVRDLCFEIPKEVKDDN